MKDWRVYVKKNKLLAGAVSILDKITAKKYKAYIVGGTVRDIIMGKDPHDVDIATNMPIDELGKLWKMHDIGKSRTFGIVVVSEKGNSYEVAQFRQDGKYKDGRRPEKVTVAGSLELDVGRRDFTVNAMGLDKDGNIIDHFDGKKDIKNRVLKAVGDPAKRFGEDYLRMMRAARFASKLDFDIDPKTSKAIQNKSAEIKKLSPERIKDEVMKSASQSGDKFAKYIEYLDSLGMLVHILPEVVKTKEFEHDVRRHPEGGVWDHTLAALRASNTVDPIQNFAILLHDVGKTVSMGRKASGEVTYYQHAYRGMKMAEFIGKRLKMSNKEIESLKFGVGEHMKFHDILKMRPSKVATLVTNKDWDVLLSVARADEMARGRIKAKDFERLVDKVLEIKRKWGMPDANKVLKLVDGNHVMELTGLSPGPKIGEIIRKTTEWIVDNNIDPKDQQRIDKHITELV